MPRRRIPALDLPDGEKLELLNVVARAYGFSPHQIGRWRRHFKLEPKSIKLPGTTGQRLTTRTWFKQFLIRVDAFARAQAPNQIRLFPKTPPSQ